MTASPTGVPYEVSHSAPVTGGLTAVLSEPGTWVAAAFVLFFVFFGRKLGAAAAKALDSRSDRIAQELETARKLREEAEELLATYRRKHQESMKEAESMLTRARADADRMKAAAEEEMQALLAARTRMAEDKITQAGNDAAQELSRQTAAIALAATRLIIAESPGGNEAFNAAALADMQRTLH